MTWIRIPAALLILSYGTAWGATLTWNANTEIDLAGYRIYQCTQQPCSRTSGTASLLATLGKVTSFNVGTPSVTQYYIITAFDSANNESSDSNVVTYTATTSTPPPPTPPPTVPPPAIGTTPVTLSFTAQQGGANPAAQTLSIANTGGGTLSWTTSEASSSKSLITAQGTANVPMKFFFPKAFIPFFTPTPESSWLRVVVGRRMCRTPRCAVAAASPTRSSTAPPPTAT